MGRGPKQTFSQRRYINDKQIYEQMLNMTNQRNANQNLNKVTPYTCQNGQPQKDKK